MKKTTKTTKQAPILGITNMSIVTMKEANQMFIQAMDRPAEGANNNIDLFVLIVSQVIDTHRSFSFNDIVSNSKCFDAPINELQKLFHLWVDFMVDIGKVEIVPTCYEDILCVVRGS